MTPPSANCATTSEGISLAAAVTIIPSKGALLLSLSNRRHDALTHCAGLVGVNGALPDTLSNALHTKHLIHQLRQYRRLISRARTISSTLWQLCCMSNWVIATISGCEIV